MCRCCFLVDKTGGAGDDVLSGQTGDDVMVGGAGTGAYMDVNGDDKFVIDSDDSEPFNLAESDEVFLDGTITTRRYIVSNQNYEFQLNHKLVSHLNALGITTLT